MGSHARQIRVESETPPSLEGACRAFASEHGYALRRTDGSIRLEKGTFFALHRREIAHTFTLASLETGTGTRIDSTGGGVFWSADRVQRFLEGRLAEFGRAIGVPTSPGPSHTGRVAMHEAPVRPGILACMVSVVAVSMLWALLYGWLDVETGLAGIAKRALWLGDPDLYLPGRQVLGDLPLFSRIAAGLFPAVPAGLVSAILAIGLFLCAELYPAVSRWIAPATFALGGAVALLVALLGAGWVALLLAPGPFLALLVWGSLARGRLGRVSPPVLLGHVGAVLVFGGLTATLLLTVTAGQDVFTRIRDRLLLGSEPGVALSEFYYRHAILASPTVQSPADPNRQKAVLGLGPKEGLDKAYAPLFREQNIWLTWCGDGPVAPAFVGGGPWDAIWVDPCFFNQPGAPSLETVAALAGGPVFLAGSPPDESLPSGVFAPGDPASTRSTLDRIWGRAHARRGLALLGIVGWFAASLLVPALVWAWVVASFVWAAVASRMVFWRKGRRRTGTFVAALIGVAALAALVLPVGHIVPDAASSRARSLAEGDQHEGSVFNDLTALLDSPVAEARAEAARAITLRLTALRHGAASPGSAALDRYVAARRFFERQEHLGKLIAGAADGDVRVRMGCVDALGALGDRGAFAVLTEAMKSDRSLMVRYRAARALGALGDARALPVLRAMAADRQAPWYLRLYALRAWRHLANR